MLQRKDDKVLFGDSLQDVEAWLRATPASWTRQSSRTNDGGPRWDLGAGWDGAQRMAREGWSAGATDMYDRLRAMPAPTEKTARWRNDVAGELPDVGRYCAGLPDHMRHRGHRLGGRPVVHIVVNNWLLAHVSAHDMANYGAALCAVVDKLEAAGRRVELDVTFAGRQQGQDVLLGWKVKHAEDSLDLAAVAFAIAHPAAFRRFGFALLEHTPRALENSGYGYNRALTPVDADAIGATDALLIDGIGGAAGVCSTQAGALAFATQQINKAAGEILVEVE